MDASASLIYLQSLTPIFRGMLETIAIRLESIVPCFETLLAGASVLNSGFRDTMGSNSGRKVHTNYCSAFPLAHHQGPLLHVVPFVSYVHVVHF